MIQPAEPYSAYAAVYDRTGQSRFSLRMLQYAKNIWDSRWPSAVLDLACGTGALAVALALRGVRVVALDRSAGMLEVAKARATRWAVGVEWVEADYRNYELGENFEAVTCFYDAINYCLREADLAAAFRATWRHVRPGGTFFFDGITRYGIKHSWGNQTDARVDPDLVRVWRSRYDTEQSQGELAITYLIKSLNSASWSRFDEIHIHRGYDPVEIQALLCESGWEPVGCYACFTREAPSKSTYRVAYLARRPL